MLHITTPLPAWHDYTDRARLYSLKSLHIGDHYRAGGWVVYRHTSRTTIVRYGWLQTWEFKGNWHNVATRIADHIHQQEAA